MVMFILYKTVAIGPMIDLRRSLSASVLFAADDVVIVIV